MASTMSWLSLLAGLASATAFAATLAPQEAERQEQSKPNTAPERGEASGLKKQTIGFVLSGWREIAMPDLQQDESCPAGLQSDNIANWEAQFPTPADRQSHVAKFATRQNRGPNGENVWFNPQTVEDPLPFKELAGKIAVGMDLDGLGSGQSNGKICSHENFSTPTGTPNIDNQLYRVAGCIRGFRKSGFWSEIDNNFIRTRPQNRILLEISDVDDEMNDDHVVVTTYKGANKVVEDAKGNILPWQSQRVVPDAREYFNRTTGRITNGVLVTTPIDVRWPVQFGQIFNMHIKEMRFQLRMTPTGATGIMAGYQDIAQYWEVLSQKGQSADYLGGMSAPTIWRALHRYADGYKDPTTGQCTAISAAHDMTFTRTLIVHPEAPHATGAAMRGN